MRIDLIYRKACDRCRGSKLIGINPFKDCPDCSGKGFTDEVMEFGGDALDTQGGSWDYLEINSSNILRQFPDLKWVVYDAYSKIITKELNPQSLHFIEEKECPLCQQHPIQMEVGLNHFSKNRIEKAHNCTDGKIEIETSFVVFDKSQEEYDAETWKEAREIIIDEFKKIKAELNSEQETNDTNMA